MGPSIRNLKNVCVFCGSSYGKGLEFVNAASTLGRSLAARNIHLVYGGGCRGLMGAVSLSALIGGSQVLGVIPKPLAENNITGKTVGEEIQVTSMHGRMKTMVDNSDAFIVLPGGFGTLEEIFQIVSWAELNIHHRPIGLLNVNNFFDLLLSFLDKAVEQKFITPSARQLLISASIINELIDKLEAFEYVPDPVLAQIDWSTGSSEGSNKNKKKKQKPDLRLHL